MNVPTTDDSPYDRIRYLLGTLPVLTKDTVPLDDSCPICLISFDVILQGETGLACLVQEDGGNEIANHGVTKLDCGHLFCRKDLSEWIGNMHGSCPTCRHNFLDIRPPSDSDDESSDGGEYLPNPDDEDEDEDVFDFHGEDIEFDVDQVEMELDPDMFGEGWPAPDDVERDIDTREWDSEPEYYSNSSGITDSDEVEVELDLAELECGTREMDVAIQVAIGDEGDEVIEDRRAKVG